MLPAYRTEGEAFSIPKFENTTQDVDGFLDELRAFHHHFRAGFARSEPREHFFNYMVGQCSTLARKSIEPMALHVEGGNIRGMQRCMSDDVWDEDQMRQTYHGLVADEMGAPDGVLMFDESGFVKKGKDSVGVARQYCGTLGKVENSQVGVFAAYASRHGYALVDKRLFLPERWFTEDYKDRRDKCNVPKDVTFHTKPQLAVEMLQAIRRENRLPFKYIVADCLYGNSPDFLDALDACVGVTALVSIPAETHCWLQRPLTTDKTYTYKGEGRAKRVVAPATQAPLTVEALAQSLASSCWYRRTVSEGTKGPIVYEFARKRVTLSKEGLPDRTGWLVLKRTLGASPTYAYSFSNAPASTPLRLFVWLSGVRWAIEQGFEETKTELGMAHYEVRKYPGWHHHILTCMLAHFFLWHLQIRLGKKSPSADGVPGADLAGSDLALAHVHGGGGPRAGGVGPAVQSPGVYVTPKAS
ncbi:MAG TPA: IS701 family transposase [Candidatus Saccharimonadia bacterium]|nr:IS701 family transposase [Candidatus Saccharimonadia bacterium]